MLYNNYLRSNKIQFFLNRKPSKLIILGYLVTLFFLSLFIYGAVIVKFPFFLQYEGRIIYNNDSICKLYTIAYINRKDSVLLTKSRDFIISFDNITYKHMGKMNFSKGKTKGAYYEVIIPTEIPYDSLDSIKYNSKANISLLFDDVPIWRKFLYY